MASRILHEFVLDKIAAVDRPCQEHAQVTIMKRAPNDEELAAVNKAAIDKVQIGLVKARLSAALALAKVGWTDAARAAAAAARARGKRAPSGEKDWTVAHSPQAAMVAEHNGKFMRITAGGGKNYAGHVGTEHVISHPSKPVVRRALIEHAKKK